MTEQELLRTGFLSADEMPVQGSSYGDVDTGVSMDGSIIGYSFRDNEGILEGTLGEVFERTASLSPGIPFFYPPPNLCCPTKDWAPASSALIPSVRILLLKTLLKKTSLRRPYSGLKHNLPIGRTQTNETHLDYRGVFISRGPLVRPGSPQVR
jgi:hypothetical protein